MGPIGPDQIGALKIGQECESSKSVRVSERSKLSFRGSNSWPPPLAAGWRRSVVPETLPFRTTPSTPPSSRSRLQLPLRKVSEAFWLTEETWLVKDGKSAPTMGSLKEGVGGKLKPDPPGAAMSTWKV